MSFLNPPADDVAALHELFEAVDEWNASSAASPVRVDDLDSGVTSADVCDSLQFDDDDSLGRSIGNGEKKKRKRVRNPVLESRRRLKKKEEAIQLRRSVVDLQNQLAQLGSISRPTPTIKLAFNEVRRPKVIRLDGHDDIAGMSAEQRELIAAEAENETLKTQIAKVEVMKRVMVDALTAMAGNCVFTCRLTKERGVDPSTVHQMYADVQLISAKIPAVAPGSILCTNNIGVDAVGAPRVEMMTGVHLESGTQRVTEIIASFFAKLCPFGRSMQHCIETQGTAIEQGFSIDASHLDVPSLLSTGVIQKHEQSDSVVIVWTSRKILPGALMSLVARAWLFIAPSPHSCPGSPKTLVRSFYDISSDSAVVGEDAQAVRALLVGAMGERLRSKHKIFLRAVLSATGRDDLAAAIAN